MKRKTIDIPKNTEDMFARCIAALKPPPELTLSEWADRYRMLSAENSAEPGRWHTDKAPYQREIMDAIVSKGYLKPCCRFHCTNALAP